MAVALPQNGAVIVLQVDAEWLHQVTTAIGKGLRAAYDAGEFGPENQPWGPVHAAIGSAHDDIMGCFGDPELGAGPHQVLVEEGGERITVTHSMKCRRTARMQECKHLALARVGAEAGHLHDGTYITRLEAGTLLWEEKA